MLTSTIEYLKRLLRLEVQTDKQYGGEENGEAFYITTVIIKLKLGDHILSEIEFEI